MLDAVVLIERGASGWVLDPRPVLSRGHRRIAFVENEPVSRQWRVVVDAERGATWGSELHSLRFSWDATRFAYTVGKGSDAQSVVDGVAGFAPDVAFRRDAPGLFWTELRDALRCFVVDGDVVFTENVADDQDRAMIGGYPRPPRPWGDDERDDCTCGPCPRCFVPPPDPPPRGFDHVAWAAQSGPAPIATVLARGKELYVRLADGTVHGPYDELGPMRVASDGAHVAWISRGLYGMRLHTPAPHARDTGRGWLSDPHFDLHEGTAVAIRVLANEASWVKLPVR